MEGSEGQLSHAPARTFRLQGGEGGSTNRLDLGHIVASQPGQLCPDSRSNTTSPASQ